MHRRVKKEEVDLIVIMTPHSATAGDTTGYLHQPGTDMKRFVPLNYQHYYVLNALREKMFELVGDRWSQVKAVYHAGDMEFYFNYPESGEG